MENGYISIKKSLEKQGPKMEQATGIEPALKAWEALILPLNYACFS